MPNPGDDTTWDEIIDTAAEKGKQVEVQSAQYEGLTVWINSMIAGAGGQIVNQSGDVKIDDSAKDAARIERKLADSKAAPAGMSTNKEDEARIGFESERSVYEINYPFIYPSAAEVSKEFQQKIGWARYPRTVPDEPSRPPLGGINIGVSAYSLHEDAAFEAAECIASGPHQAIAAEKGGLPPTTESVYDTAKVKKAYPFAELLRQSINDAAPRPVTPAYNDISLAIQKTFHPPDSVGPEHDRRQAARPPRQGGGREDLLMEAASVPARTSAPPKQEGKVTDRARSERRLAWMLCAPAVIAMLIVTGYPIGYAIYLSLQKFDLRFPDEKEFVGLANYGDVLTSSTWWTDVVDHADHHGHLGRDRARAGHG